MILEKDYRFRDDIKSDTVPIELLTEKYKGVIIRYNKVSIHEMENDQAKLKFEYDILETGNNTETTLRKDHLFENFIGLILNNLILDSLEASENEIREDNSKESD